MNEWIAYFCAGCVLVNMAMTLITVKLYTEYVKDKLQDASEKRT